eukprot:XP_011610128.1 PREDICTED: DNA repair protein XRCC3 [Takifugu rubripes]
MDRLDLELNPRIAAGVRRAAARLRSPRDVLCVSALELQTITGLSPSDVQQLLATAAAACRPHRPVPAVLLHRGECPRLEPGLRLGVGCVVINELLRGGLPVGRITELSGQSGAGKTQLALQLCLCVQYPTDYGGLDSGAVYICTENSFPIRRLQQLVTDQYVMRSDVPPSLISTLKFSDHVYVEHTADLDSLQVCLSRRVPLLLARGLARLVVLDSLAALFRCEFQAAEWQERTRQMLNVSSTLHRLSQEFSTTVLCINQVTDVFSDTDKSLGPLSSSVSPALGLTWANQVCVRLMMLRSHSTISRGNQHSALRRLEVVFGPHLARGGVDVAVWREGVRGVLSSDRIQAQHQSSQIC